MGAIKTLDRKIRVQTAQGWASVEGETGIAPIDTVVKRTLAFEQSYLGNPLVQATLFGFAIFGLYTAFNVISKKYYGAK